MIGYRQLLAPLICSGEQIVPPSVGGKWGTSSMGEINHIRPPKIGGKLKRERESKEGETEELNK